jgi:hypothetical protein
MRERDTRKSAAASETTFTHHSQPLQTGQLVEESIFQLCELVVVEKPVASIFNVTAARPAAQQLGFHSQPYQTGKPIEQPHVHFHELVAAQIPVAGQQSVPARSLHSC